jgi:hypothetical protein
MDSSDFVKDGWQAGLWLVKTVVVGSAVSFVDVTGAFSSKYDNYVISYSNINCSSNAGAVRLRFGTNASPVTTGYKYGGLFSGYTGTIINVTQNNPGLWEVGGTNTNKMAGTFIVNAPNLATHSTYQTQFARTDAAFVFSGIHEANTQHTAFHFNFSAGTVTGGQIRVYGYNN